MAVHATQSAYERDQRLMLTDRVVRFPEPQIVHEPATVEATLRALLAAAA